MTDPTPDLESIRKRHEAAVNLARDLQHATLHGPVPVATTMQMASELVWARGEIVRLTVDLESIRAALGHGADENLWPVGVTVAEAVKRLVGQAATAKDEERAAVVAWLRGEAHFTDVGPLDTFADAYADGIEAGRHREKA